MNSNPEWPHKNKKLGMLTHQRKLMQKQMENKRKETSTCPGGIYTRKSSLLVPISVTLGSGYLRQ